MDSPAKKAAAVASAAVLVTALVAQAEGYRADPYRDIAGVLTYCYGETTGLQPGKRYSEAECRALLSKRLNYFGGAVYDCLQPADVPLPTLAAFTSFAYNVGVNAACGSTAFRLARAGKVAQSCDALRMWNKAGGLVRQGLINRRERERALCLKGVTHAI